MHNTSYTTDYKRIQSISKNYENIHTVDIRKDDFLIKAKVMLCVYHS